MDQFNTQRQRQIELLDRLNAQGYWLSGAVSAHTQKGFVRLNFQRPQDDVDDYGIIEIVFNPGIASAVYAKLEGQDIQLHDWSHHA